MSKAGLEASFFLRLSATNLWRRFSIGHFFYSLSIDVAFNSPFFFLSLPSLSFTHSFIPHSSLLIIDFLSVYTLNTKSPPLVPPICSKGESLSPRKNSRSRQSVPSTKISHCPVAPARPEEIYYIDTHPDPETNTPVVIWDNILQAFDNAVQIRHKVPFFKRARSQKVGIPIIPMLQFATQG